MEARRYLNAALDVMQHHALNRARLNWALIRQRALDASAGAAHPLDVYPAIELALGNLDDHSHSRFIAPGGTPYPGLAAGTPAGRMLSRSVAYIALPGDAPGAPNTSYVSAAEATVRRAESHDPCGWVLDLRGNTGGNVYPMLIGIQPLLGSGTVGYFVPPSGHRIVVSVGPEAAREGGKGMASAVTPDRDDLSAEPVAVLIGPHTASSGEFVAIAFRGRPHTISFGTPTSGIPTGNEPYRLSDGAVLLLTTVHDADRTGHVYPDAPIQPDTFVATDTPTPTSNATDPATRAAIAWLANRNNC